MYLSLFVVWAMCTAHVEAHNNNQKLKVEQRLEAMSVAEKIDLLCAKYPGLEREGLVRYDWWSECLHGVARAGKATVFPKPIGMGCMWDDDLMLRIGTAIGDEARAKHQREVEQHGYSDRHFGLTFFSPTLNIARDPRWGRTTECFSEDPLLTSDMGVAFIRGLQGDDPYYLKAVATAKHFVANNEENRRLGGSATVDEVSLREYYFPAFKEAVMCGKATSVMGAYNALNGVPCCANNILLTDVLRGEWGFEGVVISDGSAIDKLYTHHKYVPTLEEGAALALKAGCDMSLRDEYRPGLKKAFERGHITEADLNKAACRVLMLRARLGLDKETAQGNPYTNISYDVVECENHQRLALEAAEKSMVLLKNEGVLPLKFTQGERPKIALIGEDFCNVYYGDYSGTPEHNLTLFDCLKQEIGDKADLTWIGRQARQEIVPANVLKRQENQAYDGILGFTACYYSNAMIEGATPVLTRQDLVLDVKLNDDNELKKVNAKSACWTSALTAPATGRYQLILEGSGRGKVWVDGKLMLNKYNDHKYKASFEVSLKQGQKCDLKITCEQMNPQMPVRLSWKPPFKESELSPAKLAKQADVVLLFIRDDNSSEGRDRKNLNLSQGNIDLIKEVAAANKRTVLILGGGSTLSLNEVINGPAAVLNVWIAGQGEAQAITNLLTGKTNPSGKLAVAFCANESDLPALDDYDVTKGRSYQYFKGHALFPFGYGLSYTTYAYGRPKLTKKNYRNGNDVVVTTEVKNTGTRDGEEIVQCYVSAPQWKTTGLKQKLVAYKRVPLKAGENRKVTFRIKPDQLKRWDAVKDEWVFTTLNYEISVVPCSAQRNVVTFQYK